MLNWQRQRITSLWMISEKIIKLITNAAVVIWMARYLGPESFGMLNFAIAIVALAAPFGRMGLESIIVRDMVSRPDSTRKTITAGFYLRLVATVLTVIFLSLIVVSLCNEGITLKLGLILIVTASLLFQPVDIYEQYFLSCDSVKYATICRVLQTVATAGLRISLIVSKAELEMFAFAIIFETAFFGVCLASAAAFRKAPSVFGKVDPGEIKHLLLESWPMLMSGLAVILYLRVDQVMIEYYIGSSNVGLYTAALRISEVWFALMAVYAASLLPGTVERDRSSGDQCLFLQRNFFMLIWVNILSAILITFTAGIILPLVFGEAYQSASTVLTIHVWTGPFVALGLISGNWLIAKNLQKLAMYRTIVGVLVNIFLNAILIPEFGIAGAAIASLGAQAVAALLFDCILRQTRMMFFLKLKSFTSPGYSK